MADMKVALLPWMTPNFVIAKYASRPRQEGIVEGPKWPLHEVDADALSELCDQFRAEIFEKAGKADPRNKQVLNDHCDPERTNAED